MTHPKYSREQLQSKKLSELKAIADSLGAKAEDKRSKESHINAIVEHQKASLQPIKESPLLPSASCLLPSVQAQDIARLESNQKGYKDAVAGISEQSNDPCYRVGYDRGLRDVAPQTQDASSQAIAFEAVGENIYGKIWKATVNSAEIRIVPVIGGYKSNLTGDRLLVDFGIAVKETLLAVAKINKPETPEMEVYTTATPGVYAVYSHKAGLPTNRYEVDINQQSCTCPHYQYRHEQEGFVDKHIEIVKTALRLRQTPLIREEEMLLDSPFDQLTATDMERLACYHPLPELIAA